MVLVHDDSLAQVGESYTSNAVSMHFLPMYSLIAYPQTQEPFENSNTLINLLRNY